MTWFIGDCARYENCAVHEDDVPDLQRRFQIARTNNMLPNIIDCAGKNNINEEKAKEILRLTLGGWPNIIILIIHIHVLYIIIKVC